MAYDRFLIAPLKTGLETDLKPWQIPEDAFTTMENAYLFRGRLRKRFGGALMAQNAPDTISQSLYSRFAIQLPNTDGSGNAFGAVTSISTVFPYEQTTWAVGSMFSIGTAYYTVVTTGIAQPMFQTVATPTATFDTTTGFYNFIGAPIGLAVFFYPALPVMGLTNYQQGFITNQPSYGFDTRFAYIFTGGRWNIVPDSPLWHGTNLNFFWSDCWEGIVPSITTMFVTNFYVANVPLPNNGNIADDPIWSYDSTTNWSPFSYSPDALQNPGNLQPYTVTMTTDDTGIVIANYVQTCKIIVIFKNRLLLLNTLENNATGATAWASGNPLATGITPANYVTSINTAYTNRCRYSHNGSVFARNAWLEPNQAIVYNGTPLEYADGAGYIDAPTDEQIISAEFIKDRLIVYFERSTWELVYTGNEVLPFVWQKINTELGSEATFSTVPFDKVVLTMGTTGVHACNGTNVERIDNKIPDTIFDIEFANAGINRVAGIRDYFVEQVYWTFPNENENPFDIFPNQVLVYNYKTDSWAVNDDCITAFGYFEQQIGNTWANTITTWAENQQSWGSGINQSQFRQVIAGNQQGFVFIVDSDESTNAAVMSITNILTIPTTQLTIVNHNLQPGDYIYITTSQGITGLNSLVWQVQLVISSNIVDIGVATFTGVYTGGGFVTRMSVIDIETKWLNPYIDKAKNVYIAKVDFGITPQIAANITVDYYPSSTSLSMVQAGISSGTIMGTGLLELNPYDPLYYPLEQEQELLWHTIYLQASGESIQLRIYYNSDQMYDQISAFAGFEIQGLVLYTQPLGRLE